MNLNDLPLIFLVGFATLLGLCVGSFLNVVIYRVPKMILLSQSDPPLTLSTPYSHCPACRTRLRTAYLLPVVSWIFLKGRCAQCHSRISARYPIVELLNALLWGTCVIHWPQLGSALAWAVFCSMLFALSVIDWDTTLLPDTLTLSLVWLGLIASTTGLIDISPQVAIWGAVLGYSFLWLVSIVFEWVTGKVGMGGGDLKLLAAIGAWLGPMTGLSVVMLASLLGACVGLVLKANNKLREGRFIPFGPFMSFAAITLALLQKTWSPL
jgi:leader peptidase (prepilin peptidase)/N-methyltransferase